MKVSDLSDEILPMCVKEFGTGPTASISELLDAEIWEKANTGSLIDWWERLWLEPMVSLTLQTKIWLQESRSQSANGSGQSIFGDHTLLVLCLNSHKHSQYSNDGTNNQEKSQGNLGTQDAEGEVIASSDLRPSDDEIRAALTPFIGDIEQVPPQFSAVKVEGERAYDLARDGVEMELAARPLYVERLDLIARPVF